MENEIYEVWIYRKGKTKPYMHYSLSSLEESKYMCDTIFEWDQIWGCAGIGNDVVRVEIIETQEGQVIYGRGYREDVTALRTMGVQ